MREMTMGDANEGFTAHAALFVLVMAALIVLNLFLGGVWWLVVALVGWGIVLALHYLYLQRVATVDATRQPGTEQPATTARRVA